MIPQELPMKALPNGREAVLSPEPELGAALVEPYHPSRIEPGEQSTELPAVELVAFYGALPDFFLEYRNRLTQRLMVGPERVTPCCS